MIKKVKNNKLLMQIIRFGVVGGLAFVIDYTILIICKEVFKLSVLTSSAIGFIVSIIFNYILSIKWVFDVNKKNNQKKNFVLFIIFSVIGLLLTELIMYVGSVKLKINYLFVKIVATGIVMVFNFVTRKLFLEENNFLKRK